MRSATLVAFVFSSAIGVVLGYLPARHATRWHRQVNDAFLLTLAIRSGVRLVTFDGGIGQLLATSVERQRHLRVLTGAQAA